MNRELLSRFYMLPDGTRRRAKSAAVRAGLPLNAWLSNAVTKLLPDGDASLLRRAKLNAIETGVTLTDVLTDAVEGYLV